MTTAAPAHEMVELEYLDACTAEGTKIKMEFSTNGNVLAILHARSTTLHLWPLHEDKYVAMNVDESTYGVFLDFALTPNFSFSSFGSSSLLVTSTTSHALLIWDCSSGTGRIVGVIDSEDVGDSRKIGLLPGNKAIVVCESSGNLAWYDLNDDRNPREVGGMTMREFETKPLLRHGQGDFLRDAPRSITQRNLLSNLFRRHKSDISGGSHHQQEFRFSVERCERRAAQGSYACRFSSTCQTAVLMPTPLKAFVWDLERRVQVHCVTTESAITVRQSVRESFLPLSGASDLLNRVATDPDLLVGVDHSVKESIYRAQVRFVVLQTMLIEGCFAVDKLWLEFACF